ncbi:MAG: SGNH/GDSL hydrolase family protein, partial [Rhodospirillales bacterium]|nr:SGNH/GDSL hydrolase family protein [Rhodospirillales bacterium]
LYNEEGTSAAAAVSISDFVVGNGYASQVTVDAPATAPAAGASFTLTGTYTGTAPTAMDVGFGSIAPAWVALTGFATVAGGAGGTWSGTASAPAAGPSWATVRDHTTTTSQAASSAFIVGVAGPSISVTTPGIQTVGATMTISGTYGGAAPTGLNFEFDSAGYAAAASPVISGGTWSFTATVPAAGTHTISVQEANATSVIATSGSFTTTTATTVAPGNAAILYSPYNWNVGPSAASTINAGAYLRVLFTGTSCTLGFNVAANLAPLSQIWWRIDDGAWTQAAVATSIACAIPAATLSNANVPYHLLEVVVKSTTETQNRWNAPSNTAVVFTGITLDAGAVVLAPLAAPLHVLVYGDSITEGVRTLGESAANDTDRNDAALGWAWRLGALLGAEVGVVGFGATGISVAGSGNVPALPTSYASIMSGVARGFTPAPDLVVFNIGTNDGTANTVAAMTAVLNGVIAACPAAVLAVLRPFNGNQAANLQAAIAACSAPAACHYIDTTGFFNTAYGADSLALHPSGPNGVGRIAPQVAAALRALLAGGGGAAPKGFQGGFERGLLG